MRNGKPFVWFSLLFGLILLSLGCDNPYKGKIKPQKKPKRSQARETYGPVGVAALKKELSSKLKTPQSTLQSFFQCLQKFDHNKAYAHLSEKSIKAIPKDKFLQKMGYLNPLGKLLNTVISVKKTSVISSAGRKKVVECTVTLPDLYKITTKGVELQQIWNKGHDTLMPEEDLEEQLMLHLMEGGKEKFDKAWQKVDKFGKKKAELKWIRRELIAKLASEGKMLPEYGITFSFQAHLIQEKEGWMVDFSSTWSSLQEAYKRAAVQRLRK